VFQGWAGEVVVAYVWVVSLIEMIGDLAGWVAGIDLLFCGIDDWLAYVS
jgi:hypothetical protein